MKVLSIEDEPIQQQLLSVILNRLNHQVQFAENGSDAFDMRIQNQYDLILMDIHLPIVDGIRSTEMIRKWERENQELQVPIYGLSGDTSKGIIDKCTEAGMQDVLIKPIKLNVLNSVLEKVQLRNSP